MIPFPPYRAQELKEMLIERARAALDPDTWSDKTITHLARSARGDARAAILALRQAAVAAESAGRQALKAERLSDWLEDVQRVRRDEMAEQLSLHERLVYELASHRAPILTTDLRRLYEKDCRRKGIRPVARRTFSKYIGVLRNRGLLDVDKGTTPGKGTLLRRRGGVSRRDPLSGQPGIRTRT